MDLKKELKYVHGANIGARLACQNRLDHLTKPLHSLEGLENIACHLAEVLNKPCPKDLKKALILTVDNDDTTPVDMLRPVAGYIGAQIIIPRINEEKSAVYWYEKGKKHAKHFTKIGYEVVGLAAVSNEAENITLTVKEYLQSQTDNIEEFLEIHDYKVLAYNIGLIIELMKSNVVIVIDGLIPLNAASILRSFTDKVNTYIMPTQLSNEKGLEDLLNYLEIKPYLELNAEKSAGLGALLTFTLIDGALHMLNDMKTFNEAEVAVAQDGPGALVQGFVKC